MAGDSGNQGGASSRRGLPHGLPNGDSLRMKHHFRIGFPGQRDTRLDDARLPEVASGPSGKPRGWSWDHRFRIKAFRYAQVARGKDGRPAPLSRDSQAGARDPPGEAAEKDLLKN